MSNSPARILEEREDDFAKVMTHDVEINFNDIVSFDKEDAAREPPGSLVDAAESSAENVPAWWPRAGAESSDGLSAASVEAEV